MSSLICKSEINKCLKKFNKCEKDAELSLKCLQYTLTGHAVPGCQIFILNYLSSGKVKTKFKKI